jgi:hypothetical protein
LFQKKNGPAGRSNIEIVKKSNDEKKNGRSGKANS